MKPKTEILIKYSVLAGKYPLKKIFEYLNILQKIGITNMLGATPYLYGGREWIQKQIDYFDIEEDENIEKLLDMADEIKNGVITGALKRQEGKETNDFIRSIERRVQQESKDILKIWMDFKGKVLKESIIIKSKYDKKNATNFLFEGVSKNERVENITESTFFLRRVDFNKYKQMLRFGVPYVFYDSQNLNEFKRKLLAETLSNYIYYKYKMNLTEIPYNLIYDFINKLVEVFGKLVTTYYYDFKENGRLTSEDVSDINLQENIRRILREEFDLTKIEEKTKLEKEIKKVINMMTKKDEFPVNFYDFAVQTFNDDTMLTNKELESGFRGNRTILVTTLFKESPTDRDLFVVHRVIERIKPNIKTMFGPFWDQIDMNFSSTIFSYVRFDGISKGYSPYRFK